jgi:hypothetical protein
MCEEVDEVGIRAYARVKGHSQFGRNGIGDNGNSLGDDRLEEEEEGFIDADEVEAVDVDANADMDVDEDEDEIEDELDQFKYRVRRTRVVANDSEDGDALSEEEVCQIFLYLLIVECL